jgi:hypothetical protein
MKLEPGLYVLSESRSHISGDKCFYLKVFYIGKQLYYQSNGGGASMADSFGEIPLEGFKLIKKITRPKVSKGRVTLQWEDNEGNIFDYSVKDVQLLRNLFQEYPEIAIAIGSKKYR